MCVTCPPVIKHGNIENPTFIDDFPITAGASSDPMARQEEEDAVEPVAGARGMALSAGWESPFLPTKTMERYGKGG
jgi:hypothetical protein